MIELHQVNFSYETRKLLDGCELTVPAGARVALMGPSGSGKTTLLKLMLGLLPPQSGSISLNGTVSCIFQEPRLLPWRTALQNVNAVLSDTAATEAEALAYLEAVELADAADRRPAALSGGMQQRVSIARALARGGDIFLMDEPLKGLDAALRDRMLALLQEKTAGKTVFLITHDEADARALTDRLLWLDQGRLHPRDFL